VARGGRGRIHHGAGRDLPAAARLARGPAGPGAGELGRTGGRGAVGGRPAWRCAAEHAPAFARGLLADIGAAAERRGARGLLAAAPTGAFGEQAAGAERLVPTLLGAEQSNTSIRFGDRLVLKLFRRTAPGVNPELELGEYLTAVAGFSHTPPALGAVSYRPDAGGEPLSVACLQRFVANQGDAWQFTLREVAGLLAPAAEPPGGSEEPPAADPSPEGERDLGSYPAAAALLGRRTAELHLALAARPDLPAFAPEPFSPEAQAALDAAVSRQADDSLALLERRLDGLSGPARPLAARLLARRGEIPARLRHLRERPITAARIRIHGDLHLGQVLWTGSDFVFIDFEGEPARPLADRRAKGSALRDVAGVLRSFHYAARSGAAGAAGSTGPERAAERERLLRRWHQAVSEAFLCGYLDAAGAAPFLPQDPRALRELLAVHLLEKALYELAYELNNRPDWVHLPLEGLVDLLDPS
jgi:trehalose synthase-fused probable maltokinase